MKIISGTDFLAMVNQGAVRLCSNRSSINDLNVFPIPDGDTGDNMYMTIDAGCANASGGSLADVAASVSQGMLLGARGNSGVILSRIFAGISKGLAGLSEAGTDQFASAMAQGVKEAYGAVSVPVEGTILTVLRESVERASGEDFESYLSTLVDEMRASLERTPELLDVLKEACVVDSGGAGMLCIAEGMLDAARGEVSEAGREEGRKDASVDLDAFGPDSELEFGYCTEFLLRLQTAKVGDLDSFDESVIRQWLESVGESVVAFRDGSIVKVHVHTFDPGSILTYARRWGEFLTIKVENMSLQHSEVQKARKSEFARTKPYGVVAVAAGIGLQQAFRDAGADFVIEGGQTMNPSAGSFINAFDEVGASTIFVFPNNSNIIMTAQQAAQMYGGAEIVVIPSKNIGSGYVGVASLDCSSRDTEAIAEAAREAVASVECGMLSRATRDARMDGTEIHENDWIGIFEGNVVTAMSERLDAVCELARKMNVGSHDVALVFTGADVSAEEAGKFIFKMEAACPRTEFMLTEGGQPVYDYIIALC